LEIERRGINMIKVGIPMRYCKEETAIHMEVAVWEEWIPMTYSLCSWEEAWAAAEAIAVAEVAVACLEASPTWVNKALAKASPSNSDESFSHIFASFIVY